MVSAAAAARATMRPSGAETNDSPAKVRHSSLADTVAQRHVVAVLEGRDAHLRFVESVGPFADRAGLRHDDDLCALERQRAHVLGEMAVVADGDANPAGRRRVDGRAGIARRVIALLVKARVFGDVHHARPAEQASIGIDHR